MAVRSWSPELWGVFHTLLTAQALLQMAGGAGLELLVLREASAHPERTGELLRSAARFSAASGAVCALALVGAAAVWSAPAALATALLLAAALPAAVVLPSLEAGWLARGAVERVAVTAAGEHAGRLAAGALALALGGGPALLALVFLATKWIGAALLGVPLLALRRSPAGERVGVLDLLRRARPYAQLFGAAALLGRMDSLFVAALRPLEEAGYYGAAIRIALLPVIAAQALGATLYPHLARSDRRETVRWALRSFALSLPPALVLAALGDPLLRLLRWERYLPAASFLFFLAFALPAWFFSEIVFRSFLSRGKLGTCIGITLIQVVAGLVGLAIAVPRFGAAGAAAITVAVAWLGALGYLFVLRRSRLS